jgi:hypothetical protein
MVVTDADGIVHSAELDSVIHLLFGNLQVV